MTDANTPDTVMPAMSDGFPSPPNAGQQGHSTQLTLPETPCHDGQDTNDVAASSPSEALTSRSDALTRRLSRGLGTRDERRPARERAIVEGRAVVARVFLGCETPGGRSRLEEALLHCYRTDKVAFARMAGLLLPRPMPPLDERDKAPPPVSTTVHVNQLFAMMESANPAGSAAPAGIAIPPLPYSAGRGEGRLGSQGQAPGSVLAVGAVSDGMVSRETLPGSKISGASERWVTLPGVARPVNMGSGPSGVRRGGNTGDALVDVLGVEQAARVRGEWRTQRGRRTPLGKQVNRVTPAAVVDAPVVDPAVGYVQMDDVEIVDPRDM